MNLILIKKSIEIIPTLLEAIDEVIDWWNDETPSIPKNYFSVDETSCSCGCGMNMNTEALALFNGARHIAGIPFNCISGARCPEHNKAVDGAESSVHLEGNAMDLKITTSLQRHVTLTACQAVGMNRFGMGKGKFHADCSIIKPNPRIWMY